MWGDEEREVGGPDPAPQSLRANELRMLPQPSIAPKSERHVYFL